MPPVEVPTIRSNRSAMGLAARFSISARTIAGISPRIPPPSIARIFTAADPTSPHAELRQRRLRPHARRVGRDGTRAVATAAEHLAQDRDACAARRALDLDAGDADPLVALLALDRDRHERRL